MSGKFGVQTKELDDGLEIYGMPIEEMKEGVVVHCYDDHRVAMAHSVLATVVKGTVLDEKRCVEKTWPNWWDDLENKVYTLLNFTARDTDLDMQIGLKVEGIELPHTSASASTSGSSQAAVDPEGSVLIIGMRGSGKTFHCRPPFLHLHKRNQRRPRRLICHLHQHSLWSLE